MLLEKLVAHRPHPYGIIWTFVQIMRQEDFFEHGFVKKSNEVQILLTNIKNSLTNVTPVV